MEAGTAKNGLQRVMEESGASMLRPRPSAFQRLRARLGGGLPSGPASGSTVEPTTARRAMLGASSGEGTARDSAGRPIQPVFRSEELDRLGEVLTADKFVSMVTALGAVERSRDLSAGQKQRFEGVFKLVDVSSLSAERKQLKAAIVGDEFPEVALRALELSAYGYARNLDQRGGRKGTSSKEREGLWQLCRACGFGAKVEGHGREVDPAAFPGVPEAAAVVASFKTYGPHCMYRDPVALSLATCAACHQWSWRSRPEHEDMSFMWARLDNMARTAILRKGLGLLVDAYAASPCCIAAEEIRRAMATKFMAETSQDDTILSTSIVGRLMRSFSVRVLDNEAIVDRLSLYRTETSAAQPCVIGAFRHETWGGARTFAQYAVEHCQNALRLIIFQVFEDALTQAWTSACSIREDVCAVRDFLDQNKIDSDD